MTALFRALVLGHVRSNKLRTAVTLIAVALGVAIALAIDLANATAVASFASSVNVISNHVNLQVLGVGRGFDERTILRVRERARRLLCQPDHRGFDRRRRQGRRSVLGRSACACSGVDLLRPLPGDQTASAGTPGTIAEQAGAPDPGLLVNGHGAFDQRADRDAAYGLARGSTIVRGLAGDRTVRLRVAGIIAGRCSPGVDSSVVFVDIATAQEIFEKVGRLDRIDLIADPAHLAGA